MTASRRASVSAVVLTVLAVGVMLLMIMFAARTGPQRIVHGTLVDPNLPTFVSPLSNGPTLGGPGRHHHGQGLTHSNPVLRALGLALKVALLVLMACGAWLLVSRLSEIVVLRRHPTAPTGARRLRRARRPRAAGRGDPGGRGRPARPAARWEPPQRDRGLLGPVRGAGRAGPCCAPAVGDVLGVHPAPAGPRLRRPVGGGAASSRSTTRRGSPPTRSTRTSARPRSRRCTRSIARSG